MPEIAGVALQDSGVIDAMKASDKWRFVRKTSYLKSSMQLLVESWKYNLNSSWGQNLWCTTFCWVITRRKLLVQLLAGHSKYNHAHIYMRTSWSKSQAVWTLCPFDGTWFQSLEIDHKIYISLQQIQGLEPITCIYIYTVYIYIYLSLSRIPGIS